MTNAIEPCTQQIPTRLMGLNWKPPRYPHNLNNISVALWETAGKEIKDHLAYWSPIGQVTAQLENRCGWELADTFFQQAIPLHLAFARRAFRQSNSANTQWG